MPTTETAFITKVREQIEFLQNEEYNYDALHVYVSGIAEPWVFGPDDEFEFDGDGGAGGARGAVGCERERGGA
jgi:hypothetical protein